MSINFNLIVARFSIILIEVLKATTFVKKQISIHLVIKINSLQIIKGLNIKLKCQKTTKQIAKLLFSHGKCRNKADFFFK